MKLDISKSGGKVHIGLSKNAPKPLRKGKKEQTDLVYAVKEIQEFLSSTMDFKPHHKL